MASKQQTFFDLQIARRFHYLYEWDRRRHKHGLVLWTKHVGKFTFLRITKEDGMSVLPEEFSQIPVHKIGMLLSDFLRVTTVELQKYTAGMAQQPGALLKDSPLVKVAQFVELYRLK